MNPVLLKPESESGCQVVIRGGLASYTRDASNNHILTVIDPLNRHTAYTYDSLGNITSITRLSGTWSAATTTYTYEPNFNRLSSITDPLGHAISATFDSIGNPTTVTDQAGHISTLSYNRWVSPFQ